MAKRQTLVQRKEAAVVQNLEQLREEQEQQERTSLETEPLPADIIGKTVQEHPFYVGDRAAPITGVVKEAKPGKILVEAKNLYGVTFRVLLKAVEILD